MFISQPLYYWQVFTEKHSKKFYHYLRQNCIELISNLNNVVEHLVRTEAELLLGHYSSLPPAILEVIQTSYSHCKVPIVYHSCIQVRISVCSQMSGTVCRLVLSLTMEQNVFKEVI